MKYLRWMSAILILGSCIGLISCSNKDVPPGDYDSAEVGKIKKVVPGTIISMRAVRLHNRSGEALAAGAPYPDNGDTNVNRSHGYEYVIRLNSGSIISVVQADSIRLKVKQKILVIYGANTRVVPDNGSDDY